MKAQILAQEVFGRDSMSEEAIRLGMFETVGLTWQLDDQIVENINRVKAEDIQMVAKKYFNPQQLTVAELVPEKMDKAS